DAAVFDIGVERVGIVAQSGDRYAVLADQVSDAPRLFVARLGDVDVGNTGVAALGGAGRPAHELDASEALVAGEGEYIFEAEFGEDGTDETELHGVGPSVDRSR